MEVNFVLAQTTLRIEDVLTCLLLNLAVEYAVRDSSIQTAETIFHRFTHILNDMDIISS